MPTFKTSDGVKLFYTDEGTGKPVIFVHGYSGSSDDFIIQRKKISTQFRCIAIDRRWHGQSDKPSYGLTMARQAKDIAELIQQLGLISITIVGHSMGASVVLSYLELFGTSLLSHIVTADQSPKFLNEGDWQFGFYTLNHQTATDMLQDPTYIGKVFGANYSKIKDPEMHPLPLPEPDPAILGPFMKGTNPMLRDLIYFDGRQLLSNIDKPFLAVHGRHSEFFPHESGIYIRDHVQKGKFILYEHCDHVIPQREGNLFADTLMEFIQSD